MPVVSITKHGITFVSDQKMHIPYSYSLNAARKYQYMTIVTLQRKCIINHSPPVHRIPINDSLAFCE